MRSVLRRKTRFWEWEKSGDLSSDRATRDGLSFMVTGTETWVAKYKSARQRMPVENSRLREQCAKSRISLGSSRDAASSKFLLKVPDSQPPPPPPPRSTESQMLEWDPAVCVLTSPLCEYDACYCLRVTALDRCFEPWRERWEQDRMSLPGHRLQIQNC